MTNTPSGANPQNSRAERWPSGSFYWAVLEAPGYRRAGPLPPGLLALLADEVPQAIDELHAVGVPLPSGRVLACAVTRDRLAAVDPASRSLHPSELPPDVELPGARSDQLQALNLLVGTFEPASIRRARWRVHARRAAVFGLIVTLLTIGLERRASHWRTIGAQAAAAGRQLAAQVLGADQSADRALMSLDAELERLRSLARSRPRAPADASIRLVSLLKAWPADTPSRPQSVAISESGINVSVSVDGDPTPFLTAFKSPEGWTLDEPRINSAGSVTRLTLRLRPDSFMDGKAAKP